MLFGFPVDTKRAIHEGRHAAPTRRDVLLGEGAPPSDAVVMTQCRTERMLVSGLAAKGRYRYRALERPRVRPRLGSAGAAHH